MKISPINLAKKGDKIFVVILFSNPGFNENGMCNVTADYIFHDPKGKIYGELKNKNVWENKIKLPKDQLQISIEMPSIIIEPNDPFGRYEVTAILRDNITGVELKIRQYVVIEK